jgi:hypothetical protein
VTGFIENGLGGGGFGGFGGGGGPGGPGGPGGFGGRGKGGPGSGDFGKGKGSTIGALVACPQVSPERAEENRGRGDL